VGERGAEVIRWWVRVKKGVEEWGLGERREMVTQQGERCVLVTKRGGKGRAEGGFFVSGVVWGCRREGGAR